MSEDSALERECGALTRYLTGMDPTAYVVRKYVAAHGALGPLTPRDGFDRLLVRLGTAPVGVRSLAAAFARVHAPDSALQAKLVTLLSILETSPPAAAKIDTVPTANVPWLLTLLALRGGLAVLALILATVVLWPLRLVLSDR